MRRSELRKVCDFFFILLRTGNDHFRSICRIKPWFQKYPSTHESEPRRCTEGIFTHWDFLFVCCLVRFGLVWFHTVRNVMDQKARIHWLRSVYCWKHPCKTLSSVGQIYNFGKSLTAVYQVSVKMTKIPRVQRDREKTELELSKWLETKEITSSNVLCITAIIYFLFMFIGSNLQNTQHFCSTAAPSFQLHSV